LNLTLKQFNLKVKSKFITGALVFGSGVVEVSVFLVLYCVFW